MRGVVIALGFCAGPLWAEVPKIATDIPPVHGLVSQVMGDLGTPDLVVRPGASPHGYAMRPSEAAMLERADLVVWVGPDLTQWLERSIESLAGDATQLVLSAAPGTQVLESRTGATFEAHDHDHGGREEHDDHDEHAQDGHDAHDHDEHAHDAHDDHDGHAHGAFDPHMWLDPVNAAVWLSAIAATLSDLDPENAPTYRANAQAGQQAIAAALADAQTRLTPLRDVPFVVFHDAYQYFETRMDLSAAGAISLGDASDPGPARVAEIRDTVRDLDVACVFSEPQSNPRLVRTVVEGTDARSEVLDPIGSRLTLGAGFYPELMQSLTASFEACLTKE